MVYRDHIKALLNQYYTNFDEVELRVFLGTEIQQNNWQIFNYLFIRKAIDMALDLKGNERNACSQLLRLAS